MAIAGNLFLFVLNPTETEAITYMYLRTCCLMFHSRLITIHTLFDYSNAYYCTNYRVLVSELTQTHYTVCDP